MGRTTSETSHVVTLLHQLIGHPEVLGKLPRVNQPLVPCLSLVDEQCLGEVFRLSFIPHGQVGVRA